MKIFSTKPEAPKSRNAAWSLLCVNLFGVPGLGSIAGARIFPGIMQLVLALSGVALVFWWFFQKMRLYYGQIFGTDLPLDAGNIAGWSGAIVFGIAWLWSLATSIHMIKLAPKTEIPPPLPKLK